MGCWEERRSIRATVGKKCEGLGPVHRGRLRTGGRGIEWLMEFSSILISAHISGVDRARFRQWRDTWLTATAVAESHPEDAKLKTSRRQSLTRMLSIAEGYIRVMLEHNKHKFEVDVFRNTYFVDMVETSAGEVTV